MNLREALRLADALDSEFTTGRVSNYTGRKAAAELRRLHQSEREGWRWADELEQERRRLHAVNEELLEALKACRSMVGHPDNLLFIDAAIAKAGEQA